MADGRRVQVADGVWAWLLRDGGWGWSNAGLVVDEEASLLVDTLFDLHQTRRMLASFAEVSSAADRIDALVNTHGNADHCFGNELAHGAQIFASEATADEMLAFGPDAAVRMMRFARFAAGLPWPLASMPVPGGSTMRELGEFLVDCFGAFDFRGITLTPPTDTFTGRLDWTVGDTSVEFIEVGPAHTKGDTIVHVPDRRVVFTGDILFSSGHPIVWEGPVSGWIAACETIEALQPDVVVPGHGPIAALEEVRRCRDYLVWLQDEARARFDAGMPAAEAALDITLDAWQDWSEAERVAVNVAALYREFGDESVGEDPSLAFAWMAAFRRGRA